jgi:hypothetical protein
MGEIRWLLRLAKDVDCEVMTRERERVNVGVWLRTMALLSDVTA